MTVLQPEEPIPTSLPREPRCLPSRADELLAPFCNASDGPTKHVHISILESIRVLELLTSRSSPSRDGRESSAREEDERRSATCELVKDPDQGLEGE